MGLSPCSIPFHPGKVPALHTSSATRHQNRHFRSRAHLVPQEPRCDLLLPRFYKNIHTLHLLNSPVQKSHLLSIQTKTPLRSRSRAKLTESCKAHGVVQSSQSRANLHSLPHTSLISPNLPKTPHQPLTPLPPRPHLPLQPRNPAVLPALPLPPQPILLLELLDPAILLVIPLLDTPQPRAQFLLQLRNFTGLEVLKERCL